MGRKVISTPGLKVERSAGSDRELGPTSASLILPNESAANASCSSALDSVESDRETFGSAVKGECCCSAG